jgi:beta-phosphoglucomutase-like phosphatase (HAD superfamily)
LKLEAGILDAVIFDMDGLMLDTEPIYKASWQDACRELGFDLTDEAYEAFIGRPPSDCEMELPLLFGTFFPLQRFSTRWPQIWKSIALGQGIHRKAGLDELLAQLDLSAIRTAVATSSDAGYTAFTLASAGLADRFSIVVTRDQVPRGKPAPDLYLEAARRLRVQPANCLALEDSDAGVLSASAAGMRAICVPDIKQPSRAAERAAYRVLPSLHEVRGLVRELLLSPQ